MLHYDFKCAVNGRMEKTSAFRTPLPPGTTTPGALVLLSQNRADPLAAFGMERLPLQAARVLICKATPFHV